MPGEAGIDRHREGRGRYLFDKASPGDGPQRDEDVAEDFGEGEEVAEPILARLEFEKVGGL
jgi:hypothetical protein